MRQRQAFHSSQCDQIWSKIHALRVHFFFFGTVSNFFWTTCFFFGFMVFSLSNQSSKRMPQWLTSERRKHTPHSYVLSWFWLMKPTLHTAVHPGIDNMHDSLPTAKRTNFISFVFLWVKLPEVRRMRKLIRCFRGEIPSLFSKSVRKKTAHDKNMGRPIWWLFPQ